jgi:amino acid adenylation domain-containing protein
LARGYLNRPGLTAEKFNRDLKKNEKNYKQTHKQKFLQKSPPGLLYKSGDLVKFSENGDLEYLGRIDQQVKIRGFRIEPAEIETQLLKHGGIKQAVVIAGEDENKDKYLCAYIVPDRELSIVELREYLSKDLAGYMIPSHFVFLDEIPLTTNGKVDRRRLPAPGYGYGQTPDVCVPPGDYIESRLAAIWSEVLNIPVESIGIAGNFFALGGHSLKAAVMVSRIHKALDVKVPLAVVFKSPTIKGLSGYIRQEASTDAFISIEPGEEKEYYPLSRGQERFYFLQQMAPESTAYNLMHIFHPREKILKKELEHALTRLIARHESLGTSFQVVEETGELVQMIHSPETIDFKLEYYQTNDEKEQELEEVRDIVRNFGRPFDLARAPLLRAGLICSANSRDIVMVDIHHIISDGTSLQVLVRDFMSLYDGENEELAPMKLQYKDFSQWQHDLIRSGKMKIHEDYWLRQLVGPLPEIRLPTDYPKPEERGFAGYSFRRVLEGQLVRDLRALVQHTGTTLYMVLLTAYNILLFKYTGLTDIIIGSPAARRDHADLESIIGLVMESIMMRNFPRPEKTFREFLQEVKERTLKAYEHQVYPYEELIKKLDYTKDSPWAEVTNVSLIVQNMVEIAARDTTPPADAPSYVPDTARLDLTLAVWESRETILLDFEYSTRLFKKETIERLAGHFLKILEEAIKNPDIFLSYIDIIDDGEKTRTIGSSPPFYPLSHPQKRIYYTEKVYTGTTCNTLAFTVRYNEIPDKQVLEQAINRVIQKNDALRLRIVTFDFLDEPLQYISPFKHYIIDVLDFSDTPGRSEDRLRQWIESDVRKPMPFINSNLFYFAYIRFNEKESGFYMKVHHFINDGWTVFLLIHEINDIYEALEEGRTMDETSNPSYIDYLSDELAYLKSPRAGVDREFWHRCLLPLPEKAPLSGNRKENRTNTAVTGIEGAACILPFPVDLRSKILRYSSANKTSIFKLLLSALSIFISRVNGCDDTVIGSAGHNRTNDIYRKMAGMFVSTVPLRIRIENRMDFREFVEKVGEDTNYILKNHQRYPFDRLSEELREETGIDPVYLLNINLVSHPDVPEDKFRMEHHFPGYEPTPLSIHINGNNRNIHGILELEWNYQTLHCSPEEIIRMHRCLINILDDALSYPGKKLSEIELISEEEKQQVLYRFNDTMGEGESCYSGAKTVYRLFEEQAGWSPDHVAVTGRGHISFRELDRKSGQLALVLREKGVLADDIIGIMVNRSIEMIIGIWGILKAGGAYLPIDSDYPRERIDYMLKDSGSKLLVTPDNLEALDFPSLPATGHRPPATSLAYVIYTSGSTGKPKAVGVEHGNLLGYIDAFANEFDLRADDVVIQQASFSFDAFVEEFYPILLQGGKLAVPRREEVLDMDLLSRFIRGHHVTMITCSPLMLKELSNLEYIDRLRTIRIFISGGDRLKKEYIDKLLNMGAVYNTYGPTEATVCATYYRCGADSSNGVPIGKPIRNYRVYVLDRHGNLLPVGLTGELCISGVGVARGYLNRPELTKQKFFRGSRGPAARGGAAGAFAPSRESLNCDSQLPSVPVTFIIHHSSSIIQLRPPGLLYKTGDLARWLPDANIEFMGRLDEQANIRGYRIEPGEIEYRLSQHPQVRESLVTVIEDGKGDQSLCAYIVGAEPKTSQLKDYLSQTLPDYMIPTYILAIDRIPLTPNGKVDKKSLPAPGEGQVRSARITPRNKTEEKLLRIFSDILHLEKESISIDDSFFDIGGHSLKAALLASTIHKELNVKISLAEIFNRPTIMALTRYIEKAQKERLRPIKRAERKLFYPLSSAQKRLYVLQQLEPRSTSYNMPTVVALEGDLNIGWMDMAFRELVQRHESFRTSFPMINSKPVQRIHPEVHFVVEYYDITVEWGANVEMIIRNFIRPFDLSRPPLLRVGIIKTDENKHVLMVDMHHIVSDGLSMSIFIQEFVRLYNGEELPPLQIQYKDFADWQVQQWEKGVFKKQEEYWLNRFAGEIPKLRLPFDYPTFAVSGFEGSHFIFEVEKNLLIKTREVLSRTGATLQQFLLAVYYILLSRYTRLEDIVVGCPVTGRSHADLQHVIGMFVNMLPIRSQPRGDKTFREFLEEVKENTFNAYENQDYPFEELVARLRLQGETGGNPLFDAAFALNTREGSKDEGKKGSLKVTPVEFERKVSIFAVTLRAYEAPVNLSLELEYKTARFKPSTMEKYAKRYIEILEQAVENIDLQLKDVSVSHELVALKTDVFAEDESDFRF